MELVIAMVITAMVGLSVAGVSLSLSNAYAAAQSNGTNIQTGRVSLARLQYGLNRAQLVTVADNNTLVYWQDGTNDEGQINISELVLLQYDVATRQLTQYQVEFPDTMSSSQRQALDYTVELSGAVNTIGIVRQITRNSRCVDTLLAENITSFRAAGSPACPLSKTVLLQLTVGDAEDQFTVRSAATLRIDLTANVGTLGRQYVLQ